MGEQIPCMTKSVTSYIIKTCSSVFVMVFKFQKFIAYYNSYLNDFVTISNSIQIFRKHTKNDLKKNLYKLNNAIFEKTIENVRNHVNVKLLTKWEGRYGAEAMIAKPNFHSCSVFSKNLVVVELRKLEVKFKSIYVGMYIFDVSKICLYEFHHEYVLRDKCKIMYTDTNSLIYHIEFDDVYDIMKRDISRFDISDYPTDNVVC